MSDSEAARLLERLVADADFRARFEADPAGAARAAGFGRFADDLAAADPAAMQALDVRESRSSLAGAFMAAAAEGFAMFEVGGRLFGVDDAQAAVGSPAATPAADGKPWDPDWYGLNGSGGPPIPEVEALLHNENIFFETAGIDDLRAGRIDPRVVTLLGELSRDHRIVVSCTCSDHPMHTAGGSISNHYYGRAVDIASVDGKPVNSANGAARELAVELAKLDPSIRPSEIGSPWALPGAAYFTDGDHQDHLHVGYDDPIDLSWKEPADAAAPEQAAPTTPPLDAQPDDDHAGDDLRADGTVDTSGDDDAEDDSDDEDAADDGGADDTQADDGGSAAAAPAAAAPLPADPDDWEGNLDDEDGGADEVDGSNEDEADEAGGEDDDGGTDESDDEGGSDDEEGSDDDEDEEDEDENEGADEPGEGSNGEDATDDDAGSDSGDSDPSTPSDDDSSSPSDGGSSDSSDEGSNDSSGNDSNDSSPDAGGDVAAPDGYPGDDAPREHVAAWMAAEAQERGLPPELPVMASLVESGLRNLDSGDADSVGFFQMRTSIWDQGVYRGYQDRAELQLQWFLDHAEAVKGARVAASQPIDDPNSYGEWIADVERPAEQYRGRYQLRLDEARALLEGASSGPDPAVVSTRNEAQVLPAVDPNAQG